MWMSGKKKRQLKRLEMLAFIDDAPHLWPHGLAASTSFGSINHDGNAIKDVASLVRTGSQ